jgi:DNA polymerase III alpha subunit
MRLDQYGLPIYNSQDVFNLLYYGKLNTLSSITVDKDDDLLSLENVADIKLCDPIPNIVSIEEFDALSQSVWFIPDEYKNLDIEQYVYSLSSDTRVYEEMDEYKNRKMLDLLRWLKYFVDVCDQNNIVSGVGRGSSVASYVLYLLGVHHIDSIKYNLDWREFLR